MQRESICHEQRNCWKIARARRAAFLIDGEAYFSAFAAAVERATKSILIVGWDFDSRIELVRDGRPRTLPVELGALLNALVARRRGLHAHVLGWDFAMIYALDREPFPTYTLDRRTHRRFHFALDGHHPLGASHHQKIVVVDDQVAFVGGFDLAGSRWDTPAHAADDPRRINGSAGPYSPFHDVQMMVDGEAAAALGTLVRERWRRAIGQRLRAPQRIRSDPWPSEIQPDVENVEVAIARTEARYRGYPEVREVEALYVDAIAAAQRSIYIENQYLTSAVIGEALLARLREDNGPDIVLVLPRETSGWLEETTMGVLRARLLRRLREADHYGRLRVFYPRLAGPSDCGCQIHAKVLVVDDKFVRVGSSNLNNRSMGLDSECDLAIESHGEARVAQAIAGFRNRLLGEHLGVSPETVADAITTHSSLVTAIENLRTGERRLEPIDGAVPEWLDRMVPDSALLDPEAPMAADQLIEQFVPPQDYEPGRRSLVRGAIILLALLGMAAAWRWTPLADWLALDTLTDWATALNGHPAASLVVIASYVIGGLVLVPVTLLVLATAFAFGPLQGFLYALSGCLASAAASYGIGFLLGRNVVRKLAGSRVGRLSRLIAQHGIVAMTIVRMVPIAPFTVVNLVAGASHIRFRDFMLGTALGMGPGILAITLFQYQLESTFHQPGIGSVMLLAVFVALIVFLTMWVNRRLTHNERVA